MKETGIAQAHVFSHFWCNDSMPSPASSERIFLGHRRSSHLSDSDGRVLCVLQNEGRDLGLDG